MFPLQTTAPVWRWPKLKLDELFQQGVSLAEYEQQSARESEIANRWVYVCAV